jgi:predicted nuclease with TOPRIM domain
VLMNKQLLNLSIDEIISLGVYGGLSQPFDEEDWILLENIFNSVEEETVIDELEDNIEDLKEECSSLKGDIYDLEEECENLNSKVEYLEGLLIKNGISFDGE